MSYSVCCGRFAYVSDAYNSVLGKFQPATTLSPSTPLVALADEDAKGRLPLTRDVAAGPVYDPCGLLIGRDNETFEQVERIAGLLGLHYTRRLCIYSGSQGCLSALAGTADNCGPTKYPSLLERQVAQWQEKCPDLEFEVYPEAVVVYDWSETDA